MDDRENKEDIKTFLNSCLEDMNRNFLQGFELLYIQLGRKSTPGSSNSTTHSQRRPMGKFTTDPMNSRIILDLQFSSF